MVARRNGGANGRARRYRASLDERWWCRLAHVEIGDAGGWAASSIIRLAIGKAAAARIGRRALKAEGDEGERGASAGVWAHESCWASTFALARGGAEGAGLSFHAFDPS